MVDGFGKKISLIGLFHKPSTVNNGQLSV